MTSCIEKEIDGIEFNNYRAILLLFIKLEKKYCLQLLFTHRLILNVISGEH